MASQSSLSTLRAVSYRISSTPTKQLPALIPHVTALLPACKQLLAAPQDAKAKDSSDAAAAGHKFRTQLSTMLQDRTVEGRWAAVVLVKCTVEVGGHEVLQKCAPWVRGLLSILGRPDPPTTRKLCMITLTRIFILTRDHPTLLREVTTPSLPTMIATCLKVFTAGSQSLSVQQNPVQRALLQTMLECFTQLLPRHPTIFRSYQSQLQQLLVQTIAPTPSSSSQHIPALPCPACEAARRLFVQMHCCAPKSTSTEEWESMLKAVVTSIHRTADKVFRAVIEDWESVAGISSSGHNTHGTLESDVHEPKPDAIGLPGWSGLFAGSERMIGLLRLLSQFIRTPTVAAVGVRIGLITDLLNRLLSLTIPSNTEEAVTQASLRFNNQIGREERENLFVALPQIHAATIEVLEVLVERFTDAVHSTLPGYLDQLVWIVKAENTSDIIRASVYHAAIQLVEILGSSMTKTSVDALSQMIQLACGDLLHDSQATGASLDQANGKRNGGHTTMDISLGTAAAPRPSTSLSSGPVLAAYSLLPVLLGRISAQQISVSLRTLMDRMAVLHRHKEALLASALNPPVKKGGTAASSILRLLATSFPESLEVEGMLRPRMPVTRTGFPVDGDMASDEDQAEAIEDRHPSFPPPDPVILPQNEASPESRSAGAIVAGGELPVVPLGDETMDDGSEEVQQATFSEPHSSKDIANASRSTKRSEPPAGGSPSSHKRTRRDISAQPPLSKGVATPTVPHTAAAAIPDVPIAETVSEILIAGAGTETTPEAVLPQQPSAGSSPRLQVDVAGDMDDDDDFEVPALTLGHDTSDDEDDGA
ncbi:hypothetical protein W97_08881 [Coniosporium apollinis CBS 100218]|uniref:Pre-rRNA-processing protein RIX1 n=1 Tax=Coniosporium apollinis (strain CBS 100218) TaxID=1168221 RepID=R7Z6T9_CONA1|nr:uncharacterized protein W97_08881 [Coniosporium apollinis CBS 100218]EON69621.1 hypothetical protein W97_08881 [Coniosporium apollinis CBS 100218]